MSDKVKELAKTYGGMNLSTGISPITPVNDLNTTRKVWDDKTQSTYLVDPNQNVTQLKPTQAGQNFFSKVGGQGVDIGATIARKTGSYIFNTGKSVINNTFTRGTVDMLTGRSENELRANNQSRQVIDKLDAQIEKQYTSGKINRDQYIEAKQKVAEGYQMLSKQSQAIESRAKQYTPGRVYFDAANTAAAILSMGRLQLASTVGAKAAGEGFLILNKAKPVSSVVANVEKAMQHIPAVRDLVKRNAAKLMAQEVKRLGGQSSFSYAMQNSRQIAFGLLIKRPIVYETNIGQAKEILQDLHEGEYPQAVVGGAWMASQMLSGGPLGYVWSKGKQATKYLKKVSVGNSVVDEFSRVSGHNISEAIVNGDKTVIDAMSKVRTDRTAAVNELGEAFVNELETVMGTSIGKQIENGSLSVVDAMRKIIAVNLEKAGGDVKKAVDYMYGHILHQVGGDVSRITPEMVVLSNVRWALADELTPKVAKAIGLDTNQVVVMRFDTASKKLMADFVDGLTTTNKAEWEYEITKFLDTNNMAVRDNLLFAERLKTLIEKADNPKDLAKSIRALSTGSLADARIPKDLVDEGAKLGYVFGVPKGGRQTPFIAMNDAPKLISQVSTGTAIRLLTRDIPSGLTKLVERAKSFDTLEEFVNFVKKPTNLIARDSDYLAKLEAMKYKTADEFVKNAEGKLKKTVTKTVTSVSEKTEAPQIKATRTMALGKPGVKGSAKIVYSSDDSNVQQIIRSAIIATKGTAKTASEHEAALIEMGLTKSQIKQIRDYAVKNVDQSGHVDAAGVKAILTSAKTTTENVVERVSYTREELTSIFNKTQKELGQTPTQSQVEEAFDLAKNPTKEVVTEASEIYDPAMAPVPFMSFLRDALYKTGLSPESNTKIAYSALKGSIVANLENTGAAAQLGVVGPNADDGAGYVFTRLQNYLDTRKPNEVLNALTGFRNQQSSLQDVRQMTIGNIMEALPGISKDTAKGIRKAIDKAYLDVPMEFRGLGVKAWDYMYALPGTRHMYRVMGALRYTYNPFFRAQELAETKILTKLKSNNLTWMKAGESPVATRARLDDAAKQIHEAKIFTTGYTGESTQDLTLGRLHANLLKTQERDLAGLALSIAEKKGVTLETLLRDNIDEVGEALRVIVQYPSKGVLNSALARTLNIAFFPMRYNLKVASLFATELAKQPPTVQFAVINSTLKAADWMKSPEGIRWQSEHSEAIKLFQYFTPYGNVASVYSLLKNGRVNSPSELGLIGGLPFGFITQILDSTGVINLNTPYVQPDTGEVLPDWVPQTTKAKAATALEAFIGTLFTYPGRIIGMPGKSKMIRDQVNLLMQTDYKDYVQKTRTEDLTPLQQKWIEVVKNPDNITQDTLDEMLMSPAQGEFPWYTLPTNVLPQPLPQLTDAEVRAAKANKTTRPTKTETVARPIEKR